MDGKQFNELLKNHSINGPWCLFTTDIGLRDIYVSRIEKTFEDHKVVYISTLDNFKPIGKLLNQRIIYIYVSDNCDERLFDFTEKIVQLTTKLDARTSFVKKHKDRIVELKTLDTKELFSWIKKNSTLNDVQINALLKYTNCNFAKIRNELLKYSLSDVDWQTFEQQLYDHVKDAVFDLCDSLIRGDRRASAYYLEHCKRIGEAPMVVLTVLSNNCKQILQVQNCPNPTPQNTGITNPYVIMQTRKLCGLRSNCELTTIIKICNELDMLIKTGQIDSTIVMDYVVLEVLSI